MQNYYCYYLILLLEIPPEIPLELLLDSSHPVFGLPKVPILLVNEMLVV